MNNLQQQEELTGPILPPRHSIGLTRHTKFVDADFRYTLMRESLRLETLYIPLGQELPKLKLRPIDDMYNKPAPLIADASDHGTKKLNRFPSVVFLLPSSNVGGSLQIHPRLTTCGLVTTQMDGGKLLLFWMPRNVWISDVDVVGNNSSKEQKRASISSRSITFSF